MTKFSLAYNPSISTIDVAFLIISVKIYCPNYQIFPKYCRYYMDIIIFISGFRPMSNLLTEKEVNYEGIQSTKNLARLSPNQFEKKTPIEAIR